MPRTFGRNIQTCFANIMHQPPPPSKSQSSIQEQTKENNNQNPGKIFSKNFNSLYHDPNIYNHATTLITSHMPPASPHSDDTDPTTPDFTTVYKSQRFFFSSPGHSNSITESATSSLSSSSYSSFPDRDNVVVNGGVPVLTLSPDPYLDFRRSMQEMVEARGLVDVRQKMEYLHELLTCYLSLNPKSTHKLIVGAFSDLLVSLMTSSPLEGIGRNGGGCSEKMH